MNPDDLERRMRALECFHALRVLPGAWPILRLDGRSFSRLTEARFEKPFDAAFHEAMCRTSEVRWRQADAGRCCLNGWAYWTLRKAGRSVAEATADLEGRSVAHKNELLFQHGINFNDLPAWQKRGAGLYWEQFEKQGFNPKTGQTVAAVRRRVKIDRDLALGDDYSRFIRGLVDEDAERPPGSG